MFKFLALKYFYNIIDQRELDGYIQLRYIDEYGRKHWRNRYDMVYEIYIGELIRGMHVHHKDFIKLNDNPNNLEQITREEHTKRHGIIYNSVGGSSRMLGRHHSEETKKKMSIAAIGNKNSDTSCRFVTRPEWCEKIAVSARKRLRYFAAKVRKDITCEIVKDLLNRGFNIVQISESLNCSCGVVKKRINWIKEDNMAFQSP